MLFLFIRNNPYADISLVEIQVYTYTNPTEGKTLSGIGFISILIVLQSGLNVRRGFYRSYRDFEMLIVIERLPMMAKG